MSGVRLKKYARIFIDSACHVHLLKSKEYIAMLVLNKTHDCCMYLLFCKISSSDGLQLLFFVLTILVSEFNMCTYNFLVCLVSVPTNFVKNVLTTFFSPEKMLWILDAMLIETSRNLSNDWSDTFTNLNGWTRNFKNNELLADTVLSLIQMLLAPQNYW